MHTMNNTEHKQEEVTMNEKAYRSMAFSGTINIAIGVVMIVTGVVTGVLAVICGARLLKEKNGLTF